MSRTPSLAIVLSLVLPGLASAQAIRVDPVLAPYKGTSGIAGSLSAVGSDTLNNLMALWGEAFRQRYPSVQIQIEGKGSSTAPPALIAGTAQLGPMSRMMKSTELDRFEARFGYPPTRVRVAIDALAVYLNKDNPIERMTLTDVDAIFSKDRRCGAPNAIQVWGEVAGAGGARTLDVSASPWSQHPISLYGRNSASGTYGYFKKHALCKGDYLDTVKEQPGSASVVQGVTKDRFGIGYSGIGYRTSGVKAVDLAVRAGEPYGRAEAEDVYAGRYPLSRFLYIYVNKPPEGKLDPLTREFLRYVLSREGQQSVVKDGYLPLARQIVDEERGGF